MRGETIYLSVQNLNFIEGLYLKSIHYPSSLICKSWGGFAGGWTGSQLILGIDQCLITVVVIWIYKNNTALYSFNNMRYDLVGKEWKSLQDWNWKSDDALLIPLTPIVANSPQTASIQSAAEIVHVCNLHHTQIYNYFMCYSQINYLHLI